MLCSSTRESLLAARFGGEAAGTIASAQETGTPNRRDSRVDEHNNAVGRAYGTDHAADLTAGSTSDALALLVPVALEKWETDELIWVRSH